MVVVALSLSKRLNAIKLKYVSALRIVPSVVTLSCKLKCNKELSLPIRLTVATQKVVSMDMVITKLISCTQQNKTKYFSFGQIIQIDFNIIYRW